jgi:hypothetical protein
VDEEGPKTKVARYLLGIRKSTAMGKEYRNDVGCPPLSSHKSDQRGLGSFLAVAVAIGVRGGVYACMLLLLLMMMVILMMVWAM